MKRYAAMCIMCKDENDYLLENIEYHRLVGFQHFFIYDNMSKKPLSETITGEDVTIVRWPDKEKGAHTRAFTDCLNKNRKAWNWIAFVDTDEFIVLKKHDNITDFLKNYEVYGGLGMQWKCFGGSGHKKKQKSVIHSYTHASNTGDDRHVKVIANTKFTERCSGTPHQFIYKPGKFCVNEHKKHVKGPFNSPHTYDLIQLNHYVTRSREDFDQKRLRGGGNIRHGTKCTEAFWSRFQGGKKDNAILEFLQRRK